MSADETARLLEWSAHERGHDGSVFLVEGDYVNGPGQAFDVSCDIKTAKRIADGLNTLAETQERLTALREAVEKAIKEIEGEAELNDGYAQGEVLAGNVVKKTAYRNAAAAYRVCAIVLRKATTPPITALRNAADSTKGEQ